MIINKIEITNFKCFNSTKTIPLSQNSIIVGNNGIGKSTILEAIYLSLTGIYRGKNVLRTLSKDIFNIDAVQDYIKSLSRPNKLQLPRITISVFFDTYPAYEGDRTPDGSIADGFTFAIEFDDDRHNATYAKLIESGELHDLPVELYRVCWYTFSGEIFFNPRNIGFKSLIIDSDNFSSNDFYTAKIIREFFDDADAIKMTQAQRQAHADILNSDIVKDINARIVENDALNERCVSLGISSVSRTSWENIISTQVKNIPFDNIGKGEQCFIKTLLSFTGKSVSNKSLILLEEPECHLAFSSLNRLLNFLKSKSEDYQIVITTHSSFVLNKMGVNNLLLSNSNAYLNLKDLKETTVDFFLKRTGYDTLRFILCDKSILVEGDSDELIIQRAYLDVYGNLPIEDGIDIISVGTSFARFLEIAQKLNLTTRVVLDNDGDIKVLHERFDSYVSEKISMYFADEVWTHEELGIRKDIVPNVNTLEPELLRANNRTILNRVLGVNYESDEQLLHYMVMNKTDIALKIFSSKEKITYPEYIKQAINGIK